MFTSFGSAGSISGVFSGAKSFSSGFCELLVLGKVFVENAEFVIDLVDRVLELSQILLN